jgi:hypothetical protein
MLRCLAASMRYIGPSHRSQSINLAETPPASRVRTVLPRCNSSVAFEPLGVPVGPMPGQARHPDGRRLSRKRTAASTDSHDTRAGPENGSICASHRMIVGPAPTRSGSHPRSVPPAALPADRPAASNEPAFAAIGAETPATPPGVTGPCRAPAAGRNDGPAAVAAAAAGRSAVTGPAIGITAVGTGDPDA